MRGWVADAALGNVAVTLRSTFEMEGKRFPAFSR